MDDLPPATTTRILFNPNFGKAHINPKIFRPQGPNAIHVNPKFLANTTPSPTPTSSCIQQGEILSMTRNKLVRVSAIANCASRKEAPHSSALVKIGRRKLIRTALGKSSVPPKSGQLSPFPKGNIYKVDRRPPMIKAKHFAFKKRPSKYSLNRIGRQESLIVKKRLATGRICKLEKRLSSRKALLNINGVLYKSTKTKLEKETNTSNARQKLAHGSSTVPGKRGRFIMVRGNKFLLDSRGNSLKRVHSTNSESSPLARIDIGGLTYIADSQDRLVKTDRHKTRNYLSLAKQKSIQHLSKHLTKSNVTCPIFRKVGKCAGYERGRCPKVHDRKQVSICPKYLKGECIAEECLLSHDVTLSKMPVCKFFLQGCCTRNKCPYLHKKVNEKTEICPEFLKGFCKLAGECSKRHEFLCPDFESKGKCEKIRCVHMHRKQTKSGVGSEINKTSLSPKLEVLHNSTTVHGRRFPNKANEEVETSNSRYFRESVHTSQVAAAAGQMEGNDDIDVEPDETKNGTRTESSLKLRGRPKLGELPAYIPL